MSLIIDKIDKKILFQLDLNARQSLSQIARKTGISREVVNYRIRQLEKSKVIQGYSTLIDVAKLGYMYCRVFLKYHSMPIEEEEKIIEYARTDKNISWITLSDGRWDLVLVIIASSLSELEKSYDRLLFSFGKYFQEQYVSMAYKIYHFVHNYLYETKDDSHAILGGEKSRIKLSNDDKMILGFLTLNAKTSLIDMAKQLKTSANSIKYRIKRLADEKIIIGYKVRLDTSLLGYEHYKVLLMLQNMTQSLQTKLINYLKDEANVVYITKATGISDLEFEIVVKKKMDVVKFIRNLRLLFPDLIKDYDTALYYAEPYVNYLPMFSVK